MNTRRRRLARYRRSHRDLAARPAVRLALACAWWCLSCASPPLWPGEYTSDERARERFEADRDDEHTEATRLLASINVRAALAELAASSVLRGVARGELKRLGLPLVAAHGFGEGWRNMGTVEL